MAKYIKPDQIEVLQSVGPFTNGNSESDILGVFEPEQGRDLIYLNPLNNSGSTEIVEEYDKRIPLLIIFPLLSFLVSFFAADFKSSNVIQCQPTIIEFRSISSKMRQIFIGFQ